MDVIGGKDVGRAVMSVLKSKWRGFVGLYSRRELYQYVVGEIWIEWRQGVVSFSEKGWEREAVKSALRAMYRLDKVEHHRGGGGWKSRREPLELTDREGKSRLRAEAFRRTTSSSCEADDALVATLAPLLSDHGIRLVESLLTGSRLPDAVAAALPAGLVRPVVDEVREVVGRAFGVAASRMSKVEYHRLASMVSSSRRRDCPDFRAKQREASRRSRARRRHSAGGEDGGSR